MLKCRDCGYEFEDGEQTTWYESRGEFWGNPCSEAMDGCPRCKGDYEEVYPCEDCGKICFADEMANGICGECLKKYERDFDTCYKIGKNDTDEVKLNSFIACCFTPEEIEEIICKYVKQNNIEVDCSEFIHKDEEWFADYLKEVIE